MIDGVNIIMEQNEANTIIRDKKTGAKLTINNNGSWNFVAPELPDKHHGNSILSFFTGTLINKKNS